MHWIQRPGQCLSDINRRSAAIPLGFIAIFLAEPEGSHRVSQNRVSRFQCYIILSAADHLQCLAMRCPILKKGPCTLIFKITQNQIQLEIMDLTCIKLFQLGAERSLLTSSNHFVVMSAVGHISNICENQVHMLKTQFSIKVYFLLRV